MKLATIIVTYNGSQWIEKCLNSLIQSYTFEHQIIIVDNASTDDTIFLLEKYEEKIILFESKKNLGFGQANNKGINIALDNSCDYFFLLNQDTWINLDTLPLLLKCAEKNPQYGIVSPIHMNGTSDHFDHGFETHISKGKKISPLLYDLLEKNALQSIYEVDFVNAAAWLISKKCLEKVGGFNPLFFHYAEDDDYVNRLHFHQFKIGIHPFTKIYHDRTPKTTKSDQVIYLWRMFMVECTNINTPLKPIFSQYLKTFISSSLKCLLKFRLMCFYQYAKCFFKAILSFSQLKKNRAINQNDDRKSYLYIN